MSESPKPKRAYNSTRRQKQARQTRRLIVAAARKLFYERGYAASSVDAIAQEAGVAPETVYAAFGSKQGVLLELVHTSLVGDEDPTPLLDRASVRDAAKETDPHKFVAAFAQNIANIMKRMSPVFSLLRATAKTDPEIAAVLHNILKERMRGMGFFVGPLRRIAPVREQAIPEATVWAITSAEVYDLLTRDLGWTEEQYVAWLSGTLERLLIEGEK